MLAAGFSKVSKETFGVYTGLLLAEWVLLGGVGNAELDVMDVCVKPDTKEDRLDVGGELISSPDNAGDELACLSTDLSTGGEVMVVVVVCGQRAI